MDCISQQNVFWQFIPQRSTPSIKEDKMPSQLSLTNCGWSKRLQVKKILPWWKASKAFNFWFSLKKEKQMKKIAQKYLHQENKLCISVRIVKQNSIHISIIQKKFIGHDDWPYCNTKFEKEIWSESPSMRGDREYKHIDPNFKTVTYLRRKKVVVVETQGRLLY